MTQKGKSISAASPSFLMELIRDFLVTDCGWTDETVADTYDAKHLASGWWLKSTGEDADTELFFHVGPVNKGHQTSGAQSNLQASFSHLDGAIGSGDMTIVVQDGARFAAGGCIVRIDNELINIQSVSGSTLTVATSGRGYLGTTAAAHLDKMVVLQEFHKASPDTNSAAPMVEVCAFRDVTNYVVQEVTSTSMNATSLSSSSITGYTDDRFKYAWIRITSGVYSGMMRKILTYTSTTGAFTFEPFPGSTTASFEVISNGFLTPGDRLLAYNYRTLGTFWSPYCKSTGASAIAATYFLYGNKNALVVIGQSGPTVHYFAFFGEPIRFADKATTLTTSNVSAGNAITIPVADTTLFKVGTKYRIIARTVGDWIDNKSVAPGGAAGPTNITIGETASEEIRVTAIGTGTITVRNLLFSYRTGAVIGEDPRPSILGAPGNAVLMSNAWFWPCYMPKGFGRATRILGGDQYWYNYSGFNTSNGYTTGVISPEGTTYYTSSDPSYLTERPVCGLMTLMPQGPSYRDQGVWEHVKGTLPMIYIFPGGLTLVDQDTVAARWNGSWQTFRAFRDGAAGSWFVVGPEIA